MKKPTVLILSAVLSLVAVVLCGQPSGWNLFPKITGSLDSGGDLLLASTAHVTKGSIFLGEAQNSAYDEVNDRLGIGTTSPAAGLHGVVTSGELLWAQSEADNASKVLRLGLEHYDVDEEPLYGLFVNAAATSNIVYIGGGTSGNAATTIRFYTAANTTTTTGTQRMHISGTGNVGIGTTSPAAGLHGVVTGGQFLWADSEANATNKAGRWGIEHYDVNQEPFYSVVTETATSTNILRLGGGWASGNAATQILFYTAANNTTTTGLERMRIDSSTGHVSIGAVHPAAASAVLELDTTTGALLLPRMTTAQKNALTAVNGMMVYDSTTDKFNARQAGAWVELVP